MNFRDVELLSAYLDGRLSPSDSARLEARLSSDHSLKLTLDELRETRGLLRRLPQRRAPRSFRLTPKMAGLRPPEPRAYPIFRVATVLATFLFVVSVALNGLAPFAAQRLAAAPVPVYGIGGGGPGSGGGGPSESSSAPAATEAPVLPLAAAMPTPTMEGTQQAAEATSEPPVTQDSSRNLAAPTGEANKAAPLQFGNAPGPSNERPVPLLWEIALGALAILSAVVTWLLRRNSERRFQERWNRK